MKKVKRISWFVSLGLILVGLVIVFFSLLAVGFDVRKMSNMEFTEYTYDITESFDKIHITEMTDNIELILSEDETCKIVCYDNEKIYHKCNVSDAEGDDILWIQYQDDRAWYERVSFFSFKENPKMKVYLPENKYKDITVYSANGDITIPESFAFDRAVMTTINGKVNCSADIHRYLSAEATNGSVDINGEVNGNIHVDTVNGKINIPNINRAEKADLNSTNGNIAINGNVIKRLEIQSVNGSIKFGKLQSDRIKINTVNGDIAGTVLSDKSFQGSSVNGSVSVPNGVDNGGDFVFETVNGNINIKNQ